MVCSNNEQGWCLMGDPGRSIDKFDPLDNRPVCQHYPPICPLLQLVLSPIAIFVCRSNKSRRLWWLTGCPGKSINQCNLAGNGSVSAVLTRLFVLQSMPSPTWHLYGLQQQVKEALVPDGMSWQEYQDLQAMVQQMRDPATGVCSQAASSSRYL